MPESLFDRFAGLSSATLLKVFKSNYFYRTLLVAASRKSVVHSTTLTRNYLQDKLTESNFPCLTPRSLKMLLVKFLFLSIIAMLKSSGPSCHNHYIS